MAAMLVVILLVVGVAFVWMGAASLNPRQSEPAPFVAHYPEPPAGAISRSQPEATPAREPYAGLTDEQIKSGRERMRQPSGNGYTGGYVTLTPEQMKEYHDWRPQ